MVRPRRCTGRRPRSSTRAVPPASGRRTTSCFTGRTSRPTARCGTPPASPYSTTGSSRRTTRSSRAGRCTGAGPITSRTRTNCRSCCRITAIRSAIATSGCASSAARLSTTPTHDHALDPAPGPGRGLRDFRHPPPGACHTRTGGVRRDWHDGDRHRPRHAPAGRAAGRLPLPGQRPATRQYPRLTQVGAWRRQTIIGRPDPDSTKWRFDGQPHGGFYTQDDIAELVAYAQARFVTLVPEIEMPGHSQAAIASYPELGNKPDTLPVWTAWGVDENILNPSDATIRFEQNVLTEVMALFPGRWIHIGGDEAPKTQWKASPLAQARIRELGLKDEDELQSYFTRRMDEFLTAHGRSLVGWDEILEGGLAPNAVVMSWRRIDGGIAAARAGHDVVMTPGQHTHFDY